MPHHIQFSERREEQLEEPFPEDLEYARTQNLIPHRGGPPAGLGLLSMEFHESSRRYDAQREPVGDEPVGIEPVDMQYVFPSTADEYTVEPSAYPSRTVSPVSAGSLPTSEVSALVEDNQNLQHGDSADEPESQVTHD
ncbi:hypothetical protein CKM354_000017700 [Cercospora kikuchii]|uniref:Uncharacterized protein n=1 Tax=Cercospora kikuchii TaxID=84275 RepID=A0A9P3C5B4_9PEZI|nr:uncharacterized protein CKM354_000017700 [Cercospora kikuchii]GIZ36709.1 hypothetical protein CKM354_000017700 [Cercospora kikuchii]